MPEDQEYSVMVDGFEITKVKLSYQEYRIQETRDEIRSKIAITYGIPMHYIKLCRIGFVYVTDMETGKTSAVNNSHVFN